MASLCGPGTGSDVLQKAGLSKIDIFNGVILQGNRLVIAKPMTAGCVTVEETTRKSAWQN